MSVRVREKNKGSGVWWIFIAHRGKRKSIRVGDKRSATKAAEKLGAALVLKDNGILGEEKKAILFKEQSLVWLNHIKATRRLSTYERYSGILSNQVLPVLGQTPMDEIKRNDIRILLTGVGEKLSTSMVCLTRDVVSGVFGLAIDDEVVSVNPVAGITKRMRLDKKREEVRPMTHDEVKMFLETCWNTEAEHYPLFLAAFRTGLRMGELLGLKWGDVDFSSQYLEIRRSFKRGVYGKPKNGKVRRVDMSDQLTEVLQQLKQKRCEEALKDGESQVVEAMFHRNGKPISQNSLRNIYKRLLRKAGMREMRFHDIRHTYASLLLSNGESPVYVKEQMGHSSIQVTVDIYGHLIPSSSRSAVNSLDTPTCTLSAPSKVKGL